MRKVVFLFFVFLFCVTALQATMPRMYEAVLWLNKPGISLKNVPQKTVENLRKKIKADNIKIGVFDGVPFIAIKKLPKEPKELTVSINLEPVFSNKNYLGSWDNFNICLNMKKNETDEDFLQLFDKAFYSKLICQKECPNKSFLKWRVYWKSPERITLQANIGKKGGFSDIQDAKKSIDAINALLSQAILDGPRFPKNKAEALKSGGEFYLRRAPTSSYDFSVAIREVLTKLTQMKFLQGISKADIKAVTKKIKGGIALYYLDKRCGESKMQGWQSIYNSMPIRFDEFKCAHITITRGG